MSSSATTASRDANSSTRIAMTTANPRRSRGRAQAEEAPSSRSRQTEGHGFVQRFESDKHRGLGLPDSAGAGRQRWRRFGNRRSGGEITVRVARGREREREEKGADGPS
jgi:hypothetical protein